MPQPPKPNETKDEFLGRCIPYLKNEGKPQDQSVAICYSMWREKNEDVVNKLDRMINDDGTTTGDVEFPPGEVIGMKKKKRKTRLDKKEIVVHETTYAGGTSAVPTIVGSGQTRVVGDRDGEIEVLTRRPRPLHFNRLLGAYLPIPNIIEKPEQGDDE